MNKQKLASILAIVFLSVMIVSNINKVNATSSNILYFRTDSHTVNNVTGYVLNETQTVSSLNLSATSDLGTVSWGFRVFILDNSNSSTELTSGTPTALLTRTSNGAGIQNASWTPNTTSLHMGLDALMIKVYVKIDVDDWVYKNVFVSSLLMETQLNSTAWTFSCYTTRNSTGAVATGIFSFGNSTFNSLVQGLTFPDVVLTVTSPTNTTYTSNSVLLNLSASTGPINMLWFSLKRGTEIIFLNTTYTIATTMTLGNGSYTFNAYANNTDGEVYGSTVMFTVEIIEEEAPFSISIFPDWSQLIPNFSQTIGIAYNMLAFLPIVSAVGFLLVMFYYRRLPGFLTIVELLVSMLILSITLYSMIPFIVTWFEVLGIH